MAACVRVNVHVLLYFLNPRKHQYVASAWVLSMVREGRLNGIFPANGLTTLFYLIAKHRTRSYAVDAVDHMRSFFEVLLLCLDINGWRTARSPHIADFEYAVVGSLALGAGASVITIRYAPDFVNAPIQAGSTLNLQHTPHQTLE